MGLVVWIKTIPRWRYLFWCIAQLMDPRYDVQLLRIKLATDPMSLEEVFDSGPAATVSFRAGVFSMEYVSHA